LSTAYADVTFHGYGQTVGGFLFANDRPFPTGGPFTAPSGYSTDPSFQPESNFALQASAGLSDSVTAVAQVLARGSDDFQPKFQWAYLNYRFNDTFALKAGRLQVPQYLYSDYLFVGEAYPWITLPPSLYIIQENTIDGLSLSAQTSAGDWYLLSQLTYGESVTVDNVSPSVSPPDGLTVTLTNHNGVGLLQEATYNDWLLLHFAVNAEKSSITGVPQLDQLVSAIAASSPQAAKDLAFSNDILIYYTAGIQINRWNWEVLAEFAGLDYVGGSYADKSSSAYVAVGRHFGKWLPMVTVGHTNQWSATGKALEELPANSPYAPVLQGLAESPQTRLKDTYCQLTLRYDLTSNVALKAEYAHYESGWRKEDYPGAISSFGGASITPATPPDANRLSMAVTFSF
jgi:hypothetical protein